MSEIIGEGEVRRFYKSAAAVECGNSPGGWLLELDGRPIRTPLKKTFSVPTQALALRICEEWNEQGEKIVPASMPLTGLANAAIDRIEPDSQVFIDQLTGYASSDLLCYWAAEPEDLVKRQRDLWQPVLDWVSETFGARFAVTNGILPIDQPSEVFDAIGSSFKEQDAYTLAGLVDLAGALKSVILALAVWRGRLSPDDAFEAANLDELHQEERWGMDKEALERREIIHQDVKSSAEFLGLLDMA